MSNASDIAFLTVAEYRAVKELVEWARNSRGDGVTNSPMGLVVRQLASNHRRKKGLVTRWCHVVSVGADHLICRPFGLDVPTDSSQDFAVAKPNELQETPREGKTLPNVDGELLTFGHGDDHQSRTVVRASDSYEEEQRIVTPYVPSQEVEADDDNADGNPDGPPVFTLGSLILAISGLTGGTNVNFTNSAGYVEAVTWQDLNINGRHWAEDNGS